MNQLVIEKREGPILLLTLNEPERANPLSPAMAEAVTAVFIRAAASSSIRAVVITGAGRHFSAGADLAALERLADGGSEESNLSDSMVLERLFASLLDHPKLTVAAVEGAAVAGGCGLATACDFVIAGRSAHFAYPEVRIGFIPALVSTFLTRRITPQTVRRLLLTGERIDAEEAVRIDLADRVVDPGEAVAQAVELDRDVCAKASPSAIAATKQLLNRIVGSDWRAALRAAAETNAAQRLHPECRRGVRAFLEHKQTPDWLEAEDVKD
jgi:methylglutaconyl-CoA hydratase